MQTDIGIMEPQLKDPGRGADKYDDNESPTESTKDSGKRRQATQAQPENKGLHDSEPNSSTIYNDTGADQELETLMNKGLNLDEFKSPIQETAFTSSAFIDIPDPEQIPDIIRTIPSGQRSTSISSLQSKPTTALSYADTAIPAAAPAPAISVAQSRRVEGTSASLLSPSPTVMMEHSSEVATLLSEVLDGDAELTQFRSFANGHATTTGSSSGGEEGTTTSSSSSAMSFFETGYGNQADLNTTTEESTESTEESEQRESESFLSKKKQYFILSSAGKPIYSMHGSDELITGYMGIFQAIVSYFDLSGAVNESPQAPGSAPTLATAAAATLEKKGSREQLKSVRAGNTLFVFSVEDPLILIAVDKLGESEYQLRAQLDVLYAQILSTLTKSQLAKVFRGRNNFDLRQLLGGTEVFLSALTREMSFGSPGILLGSLECLRLRKSIRNKINNIMIERRTKSLLYGMIVADSRLVSVIRPRRHSLHPPDLHLVFSMLFNTTSFSKGGEHWVPICLPKFNSTGFLYAYIYFFVPEVALVLISPDKNSFFEMQGCKELILQDLEQHQLLSPITHSLHKGRFKTLDVIAVPLVRHFLYKSRANVQFLMPSFETHYYDAHERHKLMILYHQLHGAVHAKHGHLKVYHTMHRNQMALAWVTPSFEIYCVCGNTTKEAISQSVKAIVSWIKQHEERLFVIGGAVF